MRHAAMPRYIPSWGHACRPDLWALDGGAWATRAVSGRFDNAITCFTRVLAQPELDDTEREVALVNLGHTLRRLGKWREARDKFQEALAISPESPTTLAALAFVDHLDGDLGGAIELYHRALGLRPDYAFAEDMLWRALEEAHSLLPSAARPPMATALPANVRGLLRREPLPPLPVPAASLRAGPAHALAFSAPRTPAGRPLVGAGSLGAGTPPSYIRTPGQPAARPLVAASPSPARDMDMSMDMSTDQSPD